MSEQYTKVSLLRLTVLLMKWVKPEGSQPAHVWNEDQGEVAKVIRSSDVPVIEIRGKEAPKGEGIFHTNLMSIGAEYFAGRGRETYENTVAVLNDDLPASSAIEIMKNCTGMFALLCSVDRPMTTNIGELATHLNSLSDNKVDLILLDSDVHFEDKCPVWLIWRSGHMLDEGGDPALIIDSSRSILGKSNSGS